MFTRDPLLKTQDILDPKHIHRQQSRDGEAQLAGLF